MHRVTVKAWYADAPYESRKEHPPMWTNTSTGHRVTTKDRSVVTEWDDDLGRGHSHQINRLREITCDRVFSSLYVELENGNTLECKRIRGSGKKKLNLSMPDGESREVPAYSVVEITADERGGRQ